MSNFTWQIIGRTPTDFSSDSGPPDNWRELLAARLRYRPRRIGLLAELALFGVLDCLDSAKETALPKDVVLRVCSLRGSISTISQVLQQNREGMCMPFSFLQSQTGQILQALTAALNWKGDAGIVLARNPMELAKLACHQAEGAGMLLGWVEEANPTRSAWLWLAPCILQSAGFVSAASFDEMVSPKTHYWQLRQAVIEIAHSCN